MATLGVHLVYHGTSLANAQLIRLFGIDLANRRQMTDFGKGFYTTTQWDQAAVWATQTSRRVLAETGQPSPPGIVVFTIDPSAWTRLFGRTFLAWPQLDPHGTDFVRHCRTMNALIHGYDYIYGPVYRQPWENPTPILGRDQLSVHTNRAATLLDQGLVGIWEEGGNRRWYRVTP